MADLPDEQQIKARCDAARARREASIAAYIEQMKEPILRPGYCEHEDGAGSYEMWEVCRGGQEISNHPSIYQGVEGWMAVLWVREHVSANGSGWGGQKIHTLYFDDDGSMVGVAEFDFSVLRRAMEDDDMNSQAMAAKLKSMGMLSVSSTD